jgi:hypothetical protein
VTAKRRSLARAALGALVGLAIFLSGAWGAIALWYQLPGGVIVRALGAAVWGVLAVGCIIGLAVTRHAGFFGAYVLLFATLLAWWASIPPSNDRPWADDVTQLMHGEISGDQATLYNVRNFTWRAEHDVDARWETRHYNLDHLATADAVLSYWGSPAIAHAMISFGFDTGEHVVFSVEIRKKRGQEYSPIGGFFKQFETILIAADERDIIGVRTNVRGEDDYLYPLVMPQPAMRSLFVSYVQAANQLHHTPAFYNTVSSNCTTLVYRMARRIDPGLPMDIRLLLTGYLPEYLYDNSAVDTSLPIEQLRKQGRITDKARAAALDNSFSSAIRAPR